MVTFTDPPTQRGGGLPPFGDSSGNETERQTQDANPPYAGASSGGVSGEQVVFLFPCTIHHNGRLGGLCTLFAETSKSRLEWKANLEEAMGLRKAAQESNKLFKVETLSTDTFFAPTLLSGAGPSWSINDNFTGKVTCSIPFGTSSGFSHPLPLTKIIAAPDGRALVAIGCAEGVWTGLRHDSRCMSS